MDRMIVIDTIRKPHAFGNTLFGWCLPCSAQYRPALGPRNPPSSFDIDLRALIAERGADAPVVQMSPVACPRGGSHETETCVMGPTKISEARPVTAGSGPTATLS